MDHIDKTILRLLQEDSKISAKEISKETGSPINTIYSRIKKLEDSGIIKGYKAILDDTKMGFSTTAFILANADLSQVDLEKYPDYSISAEIHKFPQVQEVFVVSGSWDYLIKVKGSTPTSLGEFVLKTLGMVKGLSATMTMVVFRKEKETLDLPI